MEVIGPICGLTARGSCSRNEGKALGDELAGAIDVDGPVELDVDDRQPDAGYRAHADDARHAVHRRLDREGDELFHFLRREALRLGEDVDRRPVEVGEYVDRYARQREQTIGHENDRRREDEQAIAQTGGDDESRTLAPTGTG